MRAESLKDSFLPAMSVSHLLLSREAKPFNSYGLVDENQLSTLNRQNLYKLGQYLQIIFHHF